MNHPIVAELERRFLPTLRATAERLQREFPNVTVNVWTSPIGSTTTYQGHNLGIDCLFRRVPPNEPDNVALSIGVMHLTTNPQLCDASVCWGAGACADCVGIELLQSPVPFSTAAINEIEAALPKLYAVLSAALRSLPFPNEDKSLPQIA